MDCCVEGGAKKGGLGFAHVLPLKVGITTSWPLCWVKLLLLPQRYRWRPPLICPHEYRAFVGNKQYYCGGRRRNDKPIAIYLVHGRRLNLR